VLFSMTTTVDVRAEIKHELLAEVARSFGEVHFKATGDSMLPSVWPGDVLTVRRQSFSEFRPGQIVLYDRGQGLVAHRMVDRSGGQLITRGDSLRRNDVPVHEDQILGRVVSIARNGRPIGADFTRGRRIAAWLLRRSDLAGRVLLGWGSLSAAEGRASEEF
jgi:hypothetical protein